MKRFFFSLIALTAAAIGCTQSALLETPDQFGTEITFSPYTGRTPVTKATSVENEADLAAGGFYVYCFLNEDTSAPYMNNVLVEGSTSNQVTTWTPTKTVYWPDANTSTSTLSFVAYSANAKDHGLSGPTISGFTFTVPTDVDDQVDLLATAYHKGHNLNNTSSGKVNLQFQHLLSRVGFKVQTTTNKSVTINALSFGGTLATTGTLDFDENIINAGTTESAIPALNVSSNKANNLNYVFLVDDSTANTKDDVTISNANQTAVPITRANNSNYLMIMPQAVAEQGDIEIHVEYTIGNKDNAKSKKAKVQLEEGFEFEAGKAYEFVLNISTSSIKFTVEQSDWGDGQSSEHPVIPDDVNKVKAVVTAGTTTATVYLTPIENGLGTIGVQYKSSSSPWESIAYDGSYDANNTVTLSLPNLSPNTTYDYRAYSIKSGETTPVTYEESTFTTKVAVTSTLVISAEETAIFADRIYIKGSIEGITLGANDKVGFCLVEGDGNVPTTDNILSTEPTTDQLKTDKIKYESATGSFIGLFTNLTSLTNYSIRAYVIINGVISYSAPIVVTTSPIIETQPENSGDNGNSGTGGGTGQEPNRPPVDEWEEPTGPDQEIPF